jgi:tRNA splicing endonuclease
VINEMGEVTGHVPPAPMLKRLGAMEATLADFTMEMDVLRRIIRKEIKELKKEVHGGGGEPKPAKKAKHKKVKEGSKDPSSSTDSSSSAHNREMKGEEESPSPSSHQASPSNVAVDHEALLAQVEAMLRQQDETQQKQLDDYCAAFGRRLEDEWKRRKREGEKRCRRIYQLERELVGLRENVLQTLVLDARKVELIHKRDVKIRELEDVLKREEEKERQLLAAASQLQRKVPQTRNDCATVTTRAHNNSDVVSALAIPPGRRGPGRASVATAPARAGRVTKH